MGRQRIVLEEVSIQVCQFFEWLLHVQINEFHPGIIVVQLWPQIKGAAKDGRQLTQLPFLQGNENSINDQMRPVSEPAWLLQGDDFSLTLVASNVIVKKNSDQLRITNIQTDCKISIRTKLYIHADVL